MTVSLLDTKPPDEWLDRVIVQRVLNGYHDQVTRPLSRAERVAVIGPMLDQIYEDARAGLFSERSQLNVAMKHYGWSGQSVSEIAKVARPGHSTRMERARRANLPWRDLVYGKRRTVQEVAA